MDDIEFDFETVLEQQPGAPSGAAAAAAEAAASSVPKPRNYRQVRCCFHTVFTCRQ